MRPWHTFDMANKPDERLIILLPSELLEEVRRAAEDEDLSVSQIVRRALRNELKMIALKDVTGTDATLILETLGKLLRETQKNAFYGDPVPGATSKRAPEKTNTTETATIVGRKPRFRI
jgi:Ribbon-helix-helix protein, copG family